MLVQLSTKIKAVKRLHHHVISHILSLRKKTHECWVNQFGTLSTYIRKLVLKILSDNLFFHQDHSESFDLACPRTLNNH